MLQSCPACVAENRDTAKFCDQCGAPLHPAVEADPPAAPPASDTVVAAAASAAATQVPAAASGQRAKGAVNWSALLFLLAILLGVWWIVKPPQEAPPGGMAGVGGDPMASMEQVQKQIAQHKATLDKDPLNVEALGELYVIYSQVGQVEKVRPHVDAALTAWKKNYPQPDEAARKVLAGLALVAIQARDDESAAKVLIAYHESEPNNLGVIATIGNLYYEMGQEEQAIEWYDKYLAVATPESQGEDFWNVLVDQATMYLQLAEGKNNANYRAALERLLRTTKENPQHWAGWYNLGQAYATVHDDEQAIAAYEQAVKIAGDNEERKWQAQNQVALLRGEEPPPMPASMQNPHAEMGGGMSLPKPPPGTPNPHGEGFGSGSNPHGEMANPHGEMANPHGER